MNAEAGNIAWEAGADDAIPQAIDYRPRHSRMRFRADVSTRLGEEHAGLPLPDHARTGYRRNRPKRPDRERETRMSVNSGASCRAPGPGANWVPYNEFKLGTPNAERQTRNSER